MPNNNTQFGQQASQPVTMKPQSAFQAQSSDAWDCTCGQKGIIGNFCNNCGAKRPRPVQNDTWNCSCGNMNIAGNFCNMCGARRPQPMQPVTWDCSCGNKGITGNFCNNCGKRRGE